MKSILELNPKGNTLHEMSDEDYAVLCRALSFQSHHRTVSQVVDTINRSGVIKINVTSKPVWAQPTVNTSFVMTEEAKP